MKKKFLLSLLSVMVLASPLFAQGDGTVRNMTVKVYQLAAEGQLGDMLAAGDAHVDSVVVIGAMNDDDVRALRAYCRDGRVLGVDISQVTLQNDSLPMSAFGWTGYDNTVENITLPSGLKVIGPYAFYAMGNLKHVELPTTLEKICHNAFRGCLIMRSISLPEGLHTIEQHALADCAFEGLTIPASVTTLKSSIAEGNHDLKTLTLLSAVTEVPGGLCNQCWTLERVVLPADVRVIQTSAFDASGLKTFSWPESLEVIGESAFSDSELEEAVLPSHLTEIGLQAFAHCQHLRSITLPASLQRVNQNSFEGSQSLTSVYSESPVPPTALGSHVAPSAVLYVPEGAVEAYKAAPWWQDFKEIRGYTPTGIRLIGTDGEAISQPAYRLDGSRAADSHRSGVYIQNGRKVVVR